VLGLFLLTLALAAGYLFWDYSRHFQSTDTGEAAFQTGGLGGLTMCAEKRPQEARPEAVKRKSRRLEPRLAWQPSPGFGVMDPSATHAPRAAPNTSTF
jgi:hypothetical protein